MKQSWTYKQDWQSLSQTNWKKKAEITKIREEPGFVTIDSSEIQERSRGRINAENFENVHLCPLRHNSNTTCLRENVFNTLHNYLTVKLQIKREGHRLGKIRCSLIHYAFIVPLFGLLVRRESRGL